MNLFQKMYEDENGYHFTKELLDYAEELMNPGAVYTVEDTNKMAKDNDITFDYITEYDWCYVVNMMHSDYYQLFGNNTDMYVKLAKAFLMDVDSCKGKAYKYFVAMHE